MADKTVSPDSFLYNGVDMLEQFKLRVVSYNLLLPSLRSRKVVVLGKSGAYNYGAKFHNERQLRLDCTIDGQLTRAQMDDLKYTLSREGRIILWDQPDRYYRGQLYDPQEVIDAFRHCQREVEIIFLCAPYASAHEPTVLSSTGAMIRPQYEGTRETFTRISVRNTGSTAMQGVRIIARQRVR